MTADDLARLGRYIVGRRAALGYKHRVNLADSLDLSDRTLADIENGVRAAGAGTYALIENALHWRPGSIAAIRAGGEPTEASEPANRLQTVSTDELFIGVYEYLNEIRSRVRSDGSVVAHDPQHFPRGGRIIGQTPASKHTGVRRDQQSG